MLLLQAMSPAHKKRILGTTITNMFSSDRYPQDDKFKQHESDLKYVVRMYDQVVTTIIPVMKQLIAPHLRALEQRLAPATTMLTWQSMNIDTFLARAHSSIQKFQEARCSTRTHAHMHARTRATLHMWTHACTHVCGDASVHIHTCTCTAVSQHARTPARPPARMHARLHARTHTHASTYANTHAHTPVHMPTRTARSSARR